MTVTILANDLPEGVGLCGLGVYEDVWVSPHIEDRDEAIELCSECPLRDRCHQDALLRDEQFFVSGAVDWEQPERDTSTVKRCPCPKCGTRISIRWPVFPHHRDPKNHHRWCQTSGHVRRVVAV